MIFSSVNTKYKSLMGGLICGQEFEICIYLDKNVNAQEVYFSYVISNDWDKKKLLKMKKIGIFGEKVKYVIKMHFDIPHVYYYYFMIIKKDGDVCYVTKDITNPNFIKRFYGKITYNDYHKFVLNVIDKEVYLINHLFKNKVAFSLFSKSLIESKDIFEKLKKLGITVIFLNPTLFFENGVSKEQILIDLILMKNEKLNIFLEKAVKNKINIILDLHLFDYYDLQNINSYFDFVKEIIILYYNLGICGIKLDNVLNIENNMIIDLKKYLNHIDKNLILLCDIEDFVVSYVYNGENKELFIGDKFDSVINHPYKDGISSYIINNNYNLLEYNLMNIFELYNEYHINLLFNFLSNNNDSIIKKIIENYCDIKNIEELNKENINQKVIFLLNVAYSILYILPGIPSITTNEIVFFERLGISNILVKLGDIKNRYDMLIDAKFKFLKMENNLIGLERYNNSEKMLCLINNSSKNMVIDYDGYSVIYNTNGSTNYELYPYSMIIMYKDRL